MNKNKFKGWKGVYDFTLHQMTAKSGFRTITVLVAVLIIGAIILATVITAKPDDINPENGSNVAGSAISVQDVYLVDKSGIASADYESLLKAVNSIRFGNVSVQYLSEEQTAEEAAAFAGNQSKYSLAVLIDKVGSNYTMKAAVPQTSVISTNEANELITAMSECFNQNKMIMTGLSQEQLQGVMMPSVVNNAKIGQDESVGVMITKMLAPMIFGLLLYFMLLMYGQTVSKEVSTEKTSKLVETLLLSVHPYGLLTGKILAVATGAFIQTGIWIVSAIGALFAGNAIAESMYPGYHNMILDMVGFLKDNVGASAFSIPSIIIAILMFCLGFIFFCTLAGLSGCMATRPEDAASTQMVFQFPIIISWLVSYFAPMIDNEMLIQVTRYLPFTSPFSVPVELLTGAVGVVEGLISLVLLAVFTVLCIMFSAKIYKGLILYNGEKVNFGIIRKVMRAEK